jgi:type I restriction enzyme S subunit
MNVPRLRFKDANGQEFPEWEENNLLDLSQNGFSNGVFNDPNKVGSGYKLVNVIDMYLDSSINEESLPLIELSEAEFLKNKVEYGDVFLLVHL